ncbi:hypothetical protein LCGC14_0413010 [marine sediment metagenome]|uniref:Uncharacterized protein n=1 Tax=marine sediment metagenome TaxID=412755 RepID=A0A0F9TBA2_9ZZZZ|nr:hypothetical protein [archaeon]
MGKGGKALGVVGLILGACGLGLGGFAWLSVSRLESQVVLIQEQNIWYKYNITNFACNPTNTYLTFSGLTVEFELGLNESVYFSFSARAHTEPIAGWSRIVVFFRVDDIFGTDPRAEVGTYNGAFPVNFMLNLQDVREDLTPGVHNVTVVIRGESGANYIHHSMLLVQKFTT